MITNLTEQNLRDFETDIANCFNNKQIKAPIHLYDGNEELIIDIFHEIYSNDWVFCSWRSHYQCLLKGVPPEEVKKKILEGKSISLCFPEYKVFSSAIVGGNIPIALGVALGLKRDKRRDKVFCFVGDMTAETGTFKECYQYSVNFDLPIQWIVEDNGKSVCTDTKLTWNINKSSWSEKPKIWYYKYSSKYPHAGAGQRIQF